ncbi:hypothetical protein [Euzebya pacifica]|jgi:hypothetical protein|uniref:hypothetical protein n=1 Tax=Euzebya pacifica TaxID=1608957 RepID=UPI0030FC2B4C
MNRTAGSEQEPTMLEARYRRLLRILPTAYRRQWEEEMVSTFLASMATDDPEEAEYLAYCGRPGWSERASVVALSVRLRLGGVDAPPQAFLWGEAVRRVALVVLLVNAVGATVMVAQQAWLAGLVPWPAVPDHVVAAADGGRPLPLDVAEATAWMGAYASLVLGRWRTARVLAALAFLPSIIGAATATVALLAGADSTPWLTVAMRWIALALMAVLLLGLAAFHEGVDRVPPRPWMLAFVVGLPATAVVQIGLLAAPALPGPLLVPSVVWSAWLLVVVALTWTGRGSTDVVGWTLTLAMLAVALLGMRVVSLLPQLLSSTGGAATHPFQLVDVVVLSTVAAVLVGRARRELRAPEDLAQILHT